MTGRHVKILRKALVAIVLLGIAASLLVGCGSGRETGEQARELQEALEEWIADFIEGYGGCCGSIAFPLILALGAIVSRLFRLT
jgi:hypothetical protein